MAPEVGEKSPDFKVRREAGFPGRPYAVIDRAGIVRAKRVESSPKDQPEVAAAPQGPDKAL